MSILDNGGGLPTPNFNRHDARATENNGNFMGIELAIHLRRSTTADSRFVKVSLGKSPSGKNLQPDRIFFSLVLIGLRFGAEIKRFSTK